MPRAAVIMASVITKGRELRVGHEDAGHEPGRRPGPDRARDADDRSVLADDQARAGDAPKRQERADREVDAARQDHEQHADRHDAGRRDLPQYVQDVALGQEGIGLVGGAEHQHDEDAGRAVAAEQLRDLDPLTLFLGQVVGQRCHVSSL